MGGRMVESGRVLHPEMGEGDVSTCSRRRQRRGVLRAGRKRGRKMGGEGGRGVMVGVQEVGVEGVRGKQRSQGMC